MDVIFETTKGRHFTIEVGYFDTVLEMKEKIQKYEGIPISRQTLVFNGQIMLDDRDTEFYTVLHRSRIQLHIQPPPPPTPQDHQSASVAVASAATKALVKIEESSSSSSSSTSKIQLLIKMPQSKKQFSVGSMELSDSVGRLKERIHEVEQGIPISRFAIIFSGNELVDNNRTLNDCGIVDLSELNVMIKPPNFPPPVTTTSSGGGGSTGSGAVGSPNKRLKLMVLPKCGTQKIQVEVNPLDNVGELKKELQKLNQRVQFHLPSDGYFFIYKQSVMDEDRSFRSQDVRQGDTIEIFNGSITGGS
ncbi:Ubiquitin domain [Macleaya cordata]|uniref:Ubiquitin domain n=1 Tax=Macleaya cordata TaxID=56857 RepID=A0A200QL43_MACCD|nr:Ubiquitin domain [Macleaya cordata]